MRRRAVSIGFSIGPVEPDVSRWPWVDRMVDLSFNWRLVRCQWLYEDDPTAQWTGRDWRL